MPSVCRSIPQSFGVSSFSFSMDRWFVTILLPTNVEKPVENELDFEGGKEPNWLLR
jgi:hypothetical protein